MTTKAKPTINNKAALREWKIKILALLRSRLHENIADFDKAYFAGDEVLIRKAEDSMRRVSQAMSEVRFSEAIDATVIQNF